MECLRDGQARGRAEVRFAQPVDAGEHDFGDERRQYLPEDAGLDAVVDNPAHTVDTQVDVLPPKRSRRFPFVHVGDHSRAQPLGGAHPNLEIFVDLAFRVQSVIGHLVGFLPDTTEKVVQGLQHQRLLARGEFIESALRAPETRGNLRDVEPREPFGKNERFKCFESRCATLADRSAMGVMGVSGRHTPIISKFCYLYSCSISRSFVFSTLP